MGAGKGGFRSAELRAQEAKQTIKTQRLLLFGSTSKALMQTQPNLAWLQEHFVHRYKREEEKKRGEKKHVHKRCTHT